MWSDGRGKDAMTSSNPADDLAKECLEPEIALVSNKAEGCIRSPDKLPKFFPAGDRFRRNARFIVV